MVLKVLPPLEITSVRSRMPGSEAIDTCAASPNVRCSYTSSVTTIRSLATARSAISDRSAGLNTLPVGLCGVLRRISFVFAVIAARSAPGS